MAIADSHALALARHIELEPGCRARTPWCGAIAEALRMLVRNLVDNAVRYTPAGGPGAGAQSAHAPGAVLRGQSIPGPGIPAAERARAFDRFYRRASAPEGGSGLGLAIVKAIAERHGARVEPGRRAGGGLRSTVRFPARLLRLA